MSNRSFDDEFDRRLEHEPTYRGHHSPAKLDGAGTLQVVLGVIPSSYATDIIERLSILRCSVCERPCNAHKCESCERTGARRVECGCGYLASDEACGCEVAA